jgi:hypothetical protein
MSNERGVNVPRVRQPIAADVPVLTALILGEFHKAVQLAHYGATATGERYVINQRQAEGHDVQIYSITKR